MEIDETTTPAVSKFDKLKAAYGAFFADSAQRSAARFGEKLGAGAGARPVRHSHNNNNNNNNFNRNPLFDQVDDYDDYYDEFDQQGLAAQERPVYIGK